MQLTTTQLQVLRADILADPFMSTLPNNGDGHIAIAALYNITAAPAFTVWRTAASVDEIMNNGFVWTAVDGLTAGKARIWQWMAQLGTINPSKLNIRQGLKDAFGIGTPMALGIEPHLKRLASRVERLFATGPGDGTDANPGTMAAGAVGFVEGALDAATVAAAMVN